MIRRPPRSTLDRSSAASDVYKRQGYKYATTPLLIWTSEMQPDNENYFPEWINLPNGGLATDILLVYATHPPDTVTLTGLPQYLSLIHISEPTRPY